MKGSELLRIVDLMHNEKHIDREIIFSGIEAALQLAAVKKFGEDTQVTVAIDRDSGDILAKKGEEIIDPTVMGRIAAQSAKQVMIQKIREAECNAVYDEYVAMKGDLVHGPISRHENGSALVSLGRSEAILPRSEQIPGETHHVGERVKTVVLDVKKAGHRVKIVLTRTHPDFVRRLFENEIPEIQDRTIEIRAIAREAGYRCKIAVSSIDLKVDCVGACVGVRGSRIKNIVDELGGERIDIVRWNDSLQVMIPNALQPAAIDEVFLYPRVGRAIVMVKEDQLSLAIGRRGQNVRLASKLVGWDIEIMTMDELNEGIGKAEEWFQQIPNVTQEMVERFIEEGFLSFDDLTFMEPAELGELVGIDEEAADDMIQFAEEMAAKIEEEKANLPPEEVQGRHHHQRSTPASAAAALFGEDATPAAPVEAKPTLDSLFGPADAAPDTPAEAAAEAPADGGANGEAPATNGEPPLEEGSDGAVAAEVPAVESVETASAGPAAHENQG